MDNTIYMQSIKSSPIGYAYQKIICDINNEALDLEFIEVNAAFERFTGLKGVDIIGKPVAEIISTVIDDRILTESLAASKEILNGNIEIEFYSKITKECLKINFYYLEKNLLITSIDNIGKESSGENKCDELRLENQLTLLHRQIEKLDDQRYVPLALVMVGVNRVDITIDVFGELAGEQYLKKIEDILKNECRADDIVARIGEREFLLLLTRTDAKFANKIINRINAAIEREKASDPLISIFMGFAVKEISTDDLNEVFDNAENELYRLRVFEGANIKRKAVDIILDTLFERSKKELIHSRKVSKYSIALAKKMEFPEKDLKKIRLAGLLHDIGKIGVDENILNKEGPLLEDEWKIIMKHSEIGQKILSTVDELSDISKIVYELHEKWDGKGYPRGISGEEISIFARLIAIADAFSSMTTNCHFRKTLTAQEAVQEIKKCAGTQFDPEISNIFVEMIMGEEA